jgi:hypothetical protein
MDLRRALAMTRPHAIRAGVTTTDHDDALSSRPDTQAVIDDITRHATVLLREEVHCQVDATKLAAGHAQIAGSLRSTRKEHRVELGAKGIGRNVDARLHTGLEHHALVGELPNAFCQHGLVHLEVRDPVSQKTTHAIGLLEHYHAVARTPQLLCRREPRGPRADDCHTIPRLVVRRARRDPSFSDRTVGDRLFDTANGDRLLDHA